MLELVEMVVDDALIAETAWVKIEDKREPIIIPGGREGD